MRDTPDLCVEHEDEQMADQVDNPEPKNKIQRDLVAAKRREMRYTLKALNDAIQAGGKTHDTYLNDWINKGNPRELKYEHRVILANMLGIREEELRVDTPRSDSDGKITTLRPVTRSRRLLAANLPSEAPEGGHEAGVAPVFRENEPIDLDAPRDWEAAPELARGRGFGVWIEQDSDRFRAMDLIWVRPTQPIRVGDPVVVIRSADRMIVAIGDFQTPMADRIVVEVGGRKRRFARPGHTAHKIVNARFT